MPIVTGDVGVAEAGDDVPDAVGQGPDPTEAQTHFFISRVVGASKGEASEVSTFVEFVKDSTHGAIGGSGKVDAVGGKVSYGSADRAGQDGRGEG